jgi:dihydrofolate reductase / thymidylate synthase
MNIKKIQNLLPSSFVSKSIMKQFNLILAKSLNNGIGINNTLPWNIKNDLKHFKNITAPQYANISFPNCYSNAIIMGKNTWLSLPIKPLPNRFNIIVSSTLEDKNLPEYTYIVKSFEEVFNLSIIPYKYYLIGGEKLFNYVMDKYQDKILDIYITDIYCNFNSDKFFNHNLNNFDLFNLSDIMEENSVKYQFRHYINKSYKHIYRNEDEIQYLNLLKKVIEEGDKRQTRNSITYSIFGEKLSFNLKKGFPLLTTKRVYWKGILGELLWFIQGNTNNKDLKEKNIHIWDGNTTKEYLEKYELPYPEDICGPIYGWQWRNFNKKYSYKNENGELMENEAGEEQGVDQLQECIKLIREDPNSRRIFMSAWNPNQLNEMCLPPCHVSYQFYVHNNELSCQMYQRSADLFLGLPFNIASTALLTTMIAHITQKIPGKIHICIGDAHLYDEHLDAVKEQLGRINDTYSFPILNIKNERNEIGEFKEEDFELINYQCHGTIKAKMAS